MLTVKINDSGLEKRILEKARSIGKSTQEIVKDLLSKALHETNHELHFQKLDPKNYGYIIGSEKKESINTDNITLFSHVEDSEKYVENLRKKAWRKL